MDGAQARVQKAMTTMVAALDKDCLRDLQAEMYRASAKCCEDRNSSLEEVQHCIDISSTKVNKAQNYIQNEIQMFQDRMQRCVMSCDDKVRHKITDSTTQDDLAKYRKQVEDCAVKCADDHISLMPSMTKTMLDTMKKNKF